MAEKTILLSEGIELSGSFCEARERRWTDFLVRAFMLFAIVAGSLGGMLSAFGISYDKWIFFAACLLSALYCASLYFAVWWENLGYILIFIFVMNAGFGLQTYISSGFYGILNDISTAATAFFGSSAQVSYAEQVENHALAISVAMCFFALIGSIFANGLAARKVRYLPVTIFSSFFLLVPIYLEKEPPASYVLLYAAGITTAYILHRHRYHAPRTRSKSYQKSIRRAAKKHCFPGSFSGRAALGTLLIVILICSATTAITELVFPRTVYQTERTRSAFKLRSMDYMENLYLLGVTGLFNFYQTTGGLKDGQLGGVNSVRLDYETDLTIEFVPYTYDRIYLKSFTGGMYVPYENRWEILYAHDDPLRSMPPPPLEVWNFETTQLLAKGYHAGLPGYARGVMKVRNVAAPVGIYVPYYTEDTLVEDTLIYGLYGTSPHSEENREQTYVFYPLLLDYLPATTGPLTDDRWLFVPEQNQDVIAIFCQKAALNGSTEEIISQLRDYFQQNFPYTLSPGATPRKKDFVNYFLAEKQKGYCAHFASAAVLILRHMGIPARYVEGYAIDAIEVATDATLTDKNVTDYYDGPSLLEPNAVVSYDASDGNAHAWVEVYDESIGWYPVEFTPFQTEEESQNSIWDMFLKLFQTDGSESTTDPQTQGATSIASALRSSAYGFALCLALLLTLVPAVFLTRKVLWHCRYRRADRSGKLLMQYRQTIRRICRKSSWDRKLGAAFATQLTHARNFEEQVLLLSHKKLLTSEKASPDLLIKALNEAAFSQTEISRQTYDEARGLL